VFYVVAHKRRRERRLAFPHKACYKYQAIAWNCIELGHLQLSCLLSDGSAWTTCISGAVPYGRLLNLLFTYQSSPAKFLISGLKNWEFKYIKDLGFVGYLSEHILRILFDTSYKGCIDVLIPSPHGTRSEGAVLHMRAGVSSGRRVM
jgi:hypothetical protein